MFYVKSSLQFYHNKTVVHIVTLQRIYPILNRIMIQRIISSVYHMIFTPAYPPYVFKAFYLLKVYLGYRRCICRYINVYFMYIFLYSFQCMPFVLCRTARVWRAFPSLGVHILIAVVLESCHRKFLHEFQLSPFFLIHSKFLNICKSKFICIYSLS